MFELVRSRVLVSEAALQFSLAVGSVGTLFWLLLGDHIHPLIVYLLQLYLSF
jgi:hypothetical protein